MAFAASGCSPNHRVDSMPRFAAPHMRVTVTHKMAAMMPNFIMPLITRSSRPTRILDRKRRGEKRERSHWPNDCFR